MQSSPPGDTLRHRRHLAGSDERTEPDGRTAKPACRSARSRRSPARSSTAFPSIDLFFAGLFHDPGAGFPAARDPNVQTLRRAFIWIGYAVFAGLALSVVCRHLWGRYLFGLTRRSICFIVVFSLLGPGLIVNNVLKDHWDRARPREIAEFGGDKAFTPPLVIADQCERNCSFVSGEAAYGFRLRGAGVSGAAQPAPAGILGGGRLRLGGRGGAHGDGRAFS